MGNILKSKKIVSILLIALLMFTTSVYAANNDSFKTTITTANTQVKRGDTVTVTIGLKDIAIESGEKGIGAYTASVQFDSSVLEYSKTESTDKWEAPFYRDGLITGNTKDGEVVNSAGSIGTITFKVKADAKLGETTISLTNFSGSTAVTDVSTSDVSVKITVTDNNSGNGNNGNGNSNNGSNNNQDNGNNNNGTQNNGSQNGENNNQNGGNNGSSNQNSGSNSSNNNSNNGNGNSNNKSNTVTDSSFKEGKLPKTGENNIVLYTIIGVFAVLAIVSFVKMRKIKV